MRIAPTPVAASGIRFQDVRHRSDSAEGFRRELSGAVSAPTPTPRPAPAADAPRVVGNPFAGPGPAASAGALPPAASDATSWCPWTGPRDSRDAVAAGGGLLTSSGAPKIQVNTAPARNQYNYAGPAARNPYFTNPSNPLREGYVAGFDNWFLSGPAIFGPGQKSTPANPVYFATAEGAQEALRLVQQYEPSATLSSRSWGGGPFLSNQPMYFINLPGGQELNAGGILDSYYNRGTGVTIRSDLELERTVRNV